MGMGLDELIAAIASDYVGGGGGDVGGGEDVAASDWSGSGNMVPTDGGGLGQAGYAGLPDAAPAPAYSPNSMAGYSIDDSGAPARSAAEPSLWDRIFGGGSSSGTGTSSNSSMGDNLKWAGVISALQAYANHRNANSASQASERARQERQSRQSQMDNPPQNPYITGLGRPVTATQFAEDPLSMMTYGRGPERRFFKAHGGSMMPAVRGEMSGLELAHGASHSGGGQDDNIPAMLSSKEYVLDADVVSALGDGNPDEGARRLDEFRKRLRLHKRSAPASKIPPKAKPIEQYLGRRAA